MNHSHTMRCILIGFGLLLADFTWANPRSFSVELSARVSESPPTITLLWTTSAIPDHVQRKILGATHWDEPVFLDPASTFYQYTDTNVAVGTTYEYFLYNSSATNGVIASGINVPVVDSRGTTVVLVDATLAPYVAYELNRFVLDLVGDGWKVIRHDVQRTNTVVQVRSLLQTDWQADTNLTSLVILGNVPQPYSGEVGPDGHNNHVGAWPTDLYYADLDGTWTDSTVSNRTATDPRNHNVPGDGKFDQGVTPSPVELEVGRVDLRDMPAFAQSGESTINTEARLLRQYLDRNHAWRHKEFTVHEQGVVDDNFGDFGGEAFAASGWRNYAALIGSENVFAGEWFDVLTTNACLLAYGCGGGHATGASGVGETTDFAQNDSLGVFTFLFGNYFGDWGYTNNFLRAPLAGGGNGLTCAWAGRPPWQIHQMGMGQTIGFCAKAVLKENNGAIWIGLMGDPTLRLHVIAPPTGLTGIPTNDIVPLLSWTHSTDINLPGFKGYHVYRSPSIRDPDPWIRLTPVPITNTQFMDPAPIGGATYSIRAVQSLTNNCGIYENMSQGAMIVTSNIPPAWITASDGEFTNKTHISWPAVTNIETYMVWRYTANRGNMASIIGNTHALSYDDDSATPGYTYYYWVTTSNHAGISAFGTGDSGYIAYPGPSNVQASAGLYVDKTHISWHATPATILYRIYRNTVNETGTAAYLGSTSLSEFDDLTGDNGTRYYYWVVSVNSGNGSSPFGIPVTGWHSSPPSALSASDGDFTDRIRLTWIPSANASGYSIYRNIQGILNSATAIGQTTGTTFDDLTAGAGVTYYYWVKASDATSWVTAFSPPDSGWRATTPTPAPTQAPSPQPPSNVGASKGSYSDRIRITWTLAADADSYEIWRHTQNDSAASSRIGVSSSVGFDDLTVTAGQTYWYWIKAKNNVGTSGFSASDYGLASVGEVDLAATNFTLLPDVLREAAIPLSMGVRLTNHGPNHLVGNNAWLRFAVYASVNDTWGDHDDFVIGAITKSVPLSVGQSLDVAFSRTELSQLRFPVTVPIGTYALFVQASPTPPSGLIDSSGGNNVAQRAGRIRAVRLSGAGMNDYDGDGKSDLALYQSNTGIWTFKMSGSGYLPFSIVWGPNAIPVPADYNGDGKTDVGVYNGDSGLWSILIAGHGYSMLLGGPDYWPAAGDYDGDGKSDPAVFQADLRRWVAAMSASGYLPSTFYNIGGVGYVAAAGDYDGDAKVDPAVYLEQSGAWSVLLSNSGYVRSSAALGGPGYAEVSADYDGDGKMDPAIYAENTGLWRFILSGSGYSSASLSLGGLSFQAVPGDYDGDGKDDPAVYNEASGTWVTLLSSRGYSPATVSFGSYGQQAANGR